MSAAGWYWLIGSWLVTVTTWVACTLRIKRAFDAGYQLGLKHGGES